ncbi:hypothetical protein Oweho_0765 [Owenweeksia hongkongensis DSM 17368]|uniref:Uncharacterized protein n=1 Tax=Owenweeksia hongkongensis (strain DSM 17368 / CIP 108786 / JCM 12287 / NRRL B-23963 / UST20020801) TaxID=926562 RepID=G8R228_OWEHD|nr:hypothetical protein Oweho_0765 [Owenweeksia hongkongensis DSM 17368]
MGNSTTLKDELGSHTKPRKETIRFILDYSKALEVKTLNSGMEIDMIKN